MKIYVVCVFLLVLAVGCRANGYGDGRPGCATSDEIETQFYRNLWDPTAYWKCSELKKPASPIRCPDEEAFQDSLKKCVSWKEWIWEAVKAPPSIAQL